jgi:molecular chaperone GrpE
MRRIPIRFADEILEDELGQASKPSQQPVPVANGDVDFVNLEREGLEIDLEDVPQDIQDIDEQDAPEGDGLSERASGELPPVETAGPVFAELIATRAELKRVEAEAGELRDGAARRQADFENFRKRIERERSETYNRAVADLVAKLLPVLDNLGRAVDTEASVEATESDEFRHFLNGVDLIHKQLGGVLEALGVKPVSAVGERFDPHLHEAVTTEATDEHEPDTVIQEIVRGYRLGDKLLRPALVKVAVKK